MTEAIKNTPQMTFTPPKVGVIPTPPKVGGKISQDTLELVNSKVPEDLQNAGRKKKNSPINIINYMWLGVSLISTAVAGSEVFKFIKKY